MKSDLEQRYDDLSTKLMNLSLLRLKYVRDHVSKMTRPKLSYMFMTLDQICDHEEKLYAKFEREDAALQECEDKLQEELDAIERQMAEQQGNIYEGSCTVVRPGKQIGRDAR